MSGVNRRHFLKYCIGSAAALGLDLSVVGKLQKALAAGGDGLPTVVWLNGANCTGCTISLANMIGSEPPTDIADLLVNYIDLAFHPNLMSAAGDLAVQSLKQATSGDFILAVDGGIPTAFGGHTCILWSEGGHEVTAKDAILSLVPQAMATLCVGTCAGFGGIPSGNPNPTGIQSVRELTGRTTINIPGCPTHPDWIVWTVAQLLAGVTPELDGDGRPSALFRGGTTNVHKRCPRKEEENAKTFGVEGLCLKELGCKGPRTQGDCPTRQWNDTTNWCIGANSICLGCTEKGFPDNFSPFYRHTKYSDSGGPSFNFQMTRAKWERERSELRLEGKGAEGKIVMVKAASTSTILGTATVDSEGKWRFRLYDPSPVPCRVMAECDGQTLERDVEDAPADCDAQPTVYLELTKAEWRAERSELKVDGKGDSGESVTIEIATTGAFLGSVTVRSDGKWRFKLKRPSAVPCRIRVRCAGESLARDVKNAPISCV